MSDRAMELAAAVIANLIVYGLGQIFSNKHVISTIRKDLGILKRRVRRCEHKLNLEVPNEEMATFHF